MKTHKKKLVMLSLLVILFPISSVNAQWVQTSGPEGGDIGTIASNGKYLFESYGDGDSISFGIRRSADHGNTWTRLNTDAFPGGVGSPKSNGSTVFMSAFYFGVYKSDDNGDSWKVLSAGSDTIREITIVNSIIYGATDAPSASNLGTTYYSTDNGSSWIKQQMKYLPRAAIDTFLFYVNYSDVYRSADKGSSWSTVTPAISGDPAFQSLAAKDQALFVAGEYGVFRSTNNGSQWTKVNNSLPLGMGIQFRNPNLRFIGDTLFMGSPNFGLFVSADKGDHWRLENMSLGNPEVGDIVKIDSFYFVGAVGGMFRSSDKIWNWSPVNSGLNHSIVMNLQQSDSLLFASTSSGFFRSADNGNTWIYANYVLPSLSGEFDVLPVGNNLILSAGSGVFRSTDNGLNWQPLTLGSNYESHLAFDGMNLLASANTYGTGSISVSVDTGKNWKIYDDWSHKDYWVTGFAVKGKKIFASTAHESTYKGSVFVTEDGGKNWSEVNSGLPGSDVFSLCLIGSKIFVGTYDGIYLSTDDGNSWNATKFTDPVFHIAFSGSTVFASSTPRTNADDCLYFSRDDFQHFKSIMEGLPSNYGKALAVNSTYLFTGDGLPYSEWRGHSVWRRPLSDLIPNAVHIDKQIAGFTLDEAYPNPCSASASISFSLSNPANITLEMFDQLGNKTSTLVTGYYEAGKYHADWDASKIANGVYYCRLQAGESSLTERLIKE